MSVYKELKEFNLINHPFLGFIKFGSEDLNNWLSCTIEDNECVKVPKNVDNSAEDTGFPNPVQKFDPASLVGKWYKTDG